MAGGGGGSSFAASGATNVSSGAITGSASQVTISYDPGTDSCPAALVVASTFTG
jgi:hypothetical protein